MNAPSLIRPVNRELRATLLEMAIAHRNASFSVYGMAPRVAKTSRRLMRQYAIRARGLQQPNLEPRC